jgi:hypothetical protein
VSIEGMNKLTAALLAPLCLTGLISPGVAETAPRAAHPSSGAGSAKPEKLEGMDYFSARTIILRYGWKPVKGACEGSTIVTGTCSLFPEIDVCSLSFPILCTMRFEKEDRCLFVRTEGESGPTEDGGVAVVDAVSFRKGSCAKL